MLTPEATLNAIDEARDVFRSAVDELLQRAKNVGVLQKYRDYARAASNDLLVDLFYDLEQELKSEIGEE